MFFENYNYMPIVPVVILRAIWYISSSEFEKTIYGSFCTRKLCVCSPKYAGYRKAWLLIWKNIKEDHDIKEGNQQGINTGRNAHLHYGEGNP